MRYYSLTLTNTAGQVYQTNSTGDGFTLGSGGSTFTSFMNGKTLPGALQIEFDIPVYPFNQPQGSAAIRVWGIGLAMIAQAANLNPVNGVPTTNFQLSAGMQKGLPLANPAQAGIILQGSIFQAFGNWQGVNQTLDLICYPGGVLNSTDIAWNWPANTPLSIALQTMFAQAFPQYTASVQVGSSLVRPNTEPGHYKNIFEFSGYLQQNTQALGIPTHGKLYPGVQIKIVGNTIYAYDGTTPAPVTQLAFEDLIGQPTWIGPASVIFKTVLRSDISLGDQIQFPQGIASPFALTSVAAAFPGAPATSKTAFQGTFTITEMHHYANFRQPDADSWNTTFTASPITLT